MGTRLSPIVTALAGVMLLLIGILVGKGGVAPSFAQAPKQIEYKVIEVPPFPDVMQRVLNEHAAAGWELAATGFGDLQAPRLILKRSTVAGS